MVIGVFALASLIWSNSSLNTVVRGSGPSKISDSDSSSGGSDSGSSSNSGGGSDSSDSDVSSQDGSDVSSQDGSDVSSQDGSDVSSQDGSSSNTPASSSTDTPSDSSGTGNNNDHHQSTNSKHCKSGKHFDSALDKCVKNERSASRSSNGGVISSYSPPTSASASSNSNTTTSVTNSTSPIPRLPSESNENITLPTDNNTNTSTPTPPGSSSSGTSSSTNSTSPNNNAPVAYNQDLITTPTAPIPGTATPPTFSPIPTKPLVVTLGASDLDNNTRLTAQIVTSPQHGSLSNIEQNTGKVSYTPNPAYIGDDSFRFKVNDGKFDSNTATIRISVTPINGSSGPGGGGSSGGGNNTNSTGQLPARNGQPVSYSQVIPVPGTSGLNVNIVITPVINGPDEPGGKTVSNFKLTHGTGNTSTSDISFTMGFSSLPPQIQQQLLAANPGVSGGSSNSNSNAAGGGTTPPSATAAPASVTTISVTSKSTTMAVVLEKGTPAHITPVYLSDTMKGGFIKIKQWFKRVDKYITLWDSLGIIKEVGAKKSEFDKAYSCLDTLTSAQLAQKSKVQRLSELNDLNEQLAAAQLTKGKVFILGVVGEAAGMIFSSTNIGEASKLETDAEINAAITEAKTIAGCHEAATQTHFSVDWSASQDIVKPVSGGGYPDHFKRSYTSRFDLVFPTIGSTTTTAVGHGTTDLVSVHISKGSIEYNCSYRSGMQFTFDVTAGKFGGKLSLVFSNPKPDTSPVPSLDFGTSNCNGTDPATQLHLFDLGCDKVTIDLSQGPYSNVYYGIYGPSSCIITIRLS